MKLYLVRHGETDYNVQGILQGHMDIPLNTTGITQAMDAGVILRDISFDRIFTSDLARAKMTAEQIAVYHPDVEFVKTELLREIDYGSYNGMKRAELKKEKGLTTFDEWMKFLQHDDQIESGASMYERAGKLCEFIAGYGEQKHVLIVSHSTFLSYLRAYLLGMNPEQAIANKRSFANCSVSIYEGIRGSRIEEIVDVTTPLHESESDEI